MSRRSLYCPFYTYYSFRNIYVHFLWRQVFGFHIPITIYIHKSICTHTYNYNWCWSQLIETSGKQLHTYLYSYITFLPVSHEDLVNWLIRCMQLWLNEKLNITKNKMTYLLLAWLSVISKLAIMFNFSNELRLSSLWTIHWQGNTSKLIWLFIF